MNRATFSRNSTNKSKKNRDVDKIPENVINLRRIHGSLPLKTTKFIEN